MIITFCGHSDHIFNYGIEDILFETIKKEANGQPVDFYLGDYGQFDRIAFRCAQKYKELQPNSKLIFVTPYIDNTYLKNREIKETGYDDIIYPELEKTPKRYAILERNKWMVKQADVVIANVSHSWGGASTTLDYAKKQKKRIINIANT